MDPIELSQFVDYALTAGAYGCGATAGAAAGCASGLGLIGTTLALGSYLFNRRRKRKLVEEGILKHEDILSSREKKGMDLVAKIKIEGALMQYNPRPTSFNPMMPSNPISYKGIKDQIDLAKRRKAKAYVFEIDCPGGAICPSFELSRLISSIEEPTYANVLMVAASGGLMVASSCDKIYVKKESMFGSIGVISQILNLRRAVKKLGVDVHVIKSAEHKALTGMFAEISFVELEMLREQLLDLHDRFVDYVAVQRNMEKELMASYADGWVHMGDVAIKLGLADEIGNEDTILDVLRVEHGLNPYLESMKKPQSPINQLLPFMGNSVSSLAYGCGQNIVNGIVDQVQSEMMSMNQFRM